MTWSVYILKCSDKTLYTGITNNIVRRLEDHKSGNGAKYTKGRGPFKLVYQEFLENRSLSTKRESEIKKLNKQEKFALIDRHKAGLRDLWYFSATQTYIIFIAVVTVNGWSRRMAWVCGCLYCLRWIFPI